MSSNTDAAFGFRAVKNIDGSPYNGRLDLYAVSSPGTVLGPGDPVALAGSANSDGIPTVVRAADDAIVVGVVAALAPDRENLDRVRYAATDSGLLYVTPAYDVIYEVQVDDNGIVLNDIGNIADYVVANANATTGRSAYELDGADIGTGDDLRILRKAQYPGNTIDTTAANGAYAIVEVVFIKTLLQSRYGTAI